MTLRFSIRTSPSIVFDGGAIGDRVRKDVEVVKAARMESWVDRRRHR